jgi:ketosteroid isomerase-like protein
MPVSAGDRIREVLALAGAMDVEGIARHLAPDVVMELPYAPPPLRRRYDGLSAVLGFQRSSAPLFSHFAIEIERVHVAAPGPTPVVVAEYTSDGAVAATGRRYRNRYVTVFELDPSDRIRRWREYYDPTVVAAAFPRPTRRPVD